MKPKHFGSQDFTVFMVFSPSSRRFLAWRSTPKTLLAATLGLLLAGSQLMIAQQDKKQELRELTRAAGTMFSAGRHDEGIIEAGKGPCLC